MGGKEIEFQGKEEAGGGGGRRENGLYQNTAKSVTKQVFKGRIYSWKGMKF